MKPSCSSTRSRSESVRGLMPGHERSSSEKRRGPSDRSCTTSAVHFVPMMSAQHATAHVSSWTGSIVRAIAVQADVRDPRSVEKLFGEVRSRFGRLDLLFNNAGAVAPAVPLEELTL